jgi:putative tricarboxylic transport membrane protein
MRLNDAATGGIVAVLGIAVVAYSWTFPPMPGQTIGPSLFPAVIGYGLLALGAALVLSRGRDRDAPWVALDDWMGTRSAVAKFSVVIAILIFYVAALDRLGFFLTSFVFVGVLCFAFGVPRKQIIPISLGVPVVIHYAFYSLLRVPLPWGLLERIAW